jgi:hypothetical protein
VGANVFCWETKDILADAHGCGSELGSDKRASDEAVSVVSDHCANQAVRVATRIGQNPTDYLGPAKDRAKYREMGGVLMHCFAADISLLEFESDGEGLRGCKERIGKLQGPIAFYETQIPKAQRLGPTIAVDMTVFAGPHCKEKGTNGQLCGCPFTS